MRLRVLMCAIAVLIAVGFVGARSSSDTSVSHLSIAGRRNATPSIAAYRDFVAVAWSATAQGGASDVYVAVSRNGGASFGPPNQVNDQAGEARSGGEMPPRVALVPAAGGGDPAIVVLWRAKNPTTKLAGCPDEGPAMAVDAEGVVHVAWPTVIGGEQPEGAIFYASSRDGRTFTPRLRVPTLGSSKPSHPQLAATPDGRVAIAWDEARDGRRQAAMTMLMSDGSRSVFSPPVVLEPLPLAALYPALATTAHHIVTAWTSGSAETSTIAVRRLPQMDAEKP